MITMNSTFEKRMEEMLQNEMPDYVASLETPLFQGLRLSSRKQDKELTQRSLSFLKNPSPFSKNAWYIHGQHGLHPAHLQGLFYLQEPSAGSAVEVLDPKKDDIVLDLCAAPGSKSTQIIERLGEGGFLWSNEIDSKRAQVLLSNMERMGAENFLVSNMDSKTLCSQTPELFDKILVDAPCSGEGMMKKHEAALNQWSYENILLCASRQKEILAQAWQALKPGGQLVYSTCTYAKEENEENVAWLLETFLDAKQLDVDVSWGRPGFETLGMEASKVRRIFPMDGGEGHFIAKFEKQGKAFSTLGLPEAKSIKLPNIVTTFLKTQVNPGYSYYYSEPSKESIRFYGMNHPFFQVKKGKVLRQGVLLGEMVKNRFEPAHAFYLSPLMAKHALSKTETTLEEMDAFYHGQQLNLQAPKGFRALCYQGIPYGFGKSSQGRITNKLPKGLRLNPNSHVHLD